jgi:ectoine hydroxylase-related dioxygenase (phytanoyl-CoA dioxygenase family)
MQTKLEIKTAFDIDGFVVVKGCLPRALVDDYLSQVREVIDHVAARQNVPLCSDMTTDDAFNALCEANRAFGGMVYDCMRLHPLMPALAAHPKIVDTAAELLDARLCFHVHDQVHFRIDRKDEERFHLTWHQDYWYNNTTAHAVTAWIPLVDVPAEKGPMRFIPGSHAAPLPVRVDPQFHKKWDMSRLILAADPIAFDAGVDVPAEAGDVVFLHALSVHRSGLNQCDGNRFTVVLRFSDLLHDELVDKRWKIGVRVGWASLIEQRPDLIRNYDELRQTGAV